MRVCTRTRERALESGTAGYHHSTTISVNKNSWEANMEPIVWEPSGTGESEGTVPALTEVPSCLGGAGRQGAMALCHPVSLSKWEDEVQRDCCPTHLVEVSFLLLLYHTKTVFQKLRFGKNCPFHTRLQQLNRCPKFLGVTALIKHLIECSSNIHEEQEQQSSGRGKTRK